MDRMKAIFGKRKFTIALLALILTFVLALIGVVDGSNWMMSVAAIVGLYSGFEAGEGAAHAIANSRSA